VEQCDVVQRAVWCYFTACAIAFYINIKMYSHSRCQQVHSKSYVDKQKHKKTPLVYKNSQYNNRKDLRTNQLFQQLITYFFIYLIS